MKHLGPFLLVSIGVGILDDLGFVFNIGLSSSEGYLWMSVASLVWVGIFGVALYCLHWRSLWLLVGLPLVILPYAGAIIGGGMI